jgi:LPXTG-motif cell wall-anchored protein
MLPIFLPQCTTNRVSRRIALAECPDWRHGWREVARYAAETEGDYQMTEEPLPNTGKTQWLWLALIGSLGVLLIIYVIANWTIHSDVKQGASAGGLTFPANPGVEVAGQKRSDQPQQ